MANKAQQSSETQKRGFSLPQTTAKPPMPPVKKPKIEGDKSNKNRKVKK